MRHRDSIVENLKGIYITSRIIDSHCTANLACGCIHEYNTVKLAMPTRLRNCLTFFFYKSLCLTSLGLIRFRFRIDIFFLIKDIWIDLVRLLTICRLYQINKVTRVCVVVEKGWGTVRPFSSLRSVPSIMKLTWT